MAERLTFLVLGDETAAGTRPVSELTGINPALDDAQADCQIWNIQAQAWQSLQPGVNTNTNQASSDRWSFESRLREAIRTYKPTGTYYVVKYAADSTLLQYGVKPSWDPINPAGMFAGLVTQLTAAAAAANVAGDTLKVVGVISSIMTDDWRQASLGRELYHVMLNLIEKVRDKLVSIPHCAAGSFAEDGGLTPWIVLAHHYNWDAPYTGFDLEEGVLHSNRLRLEMVEQPKDNIRVQRTHGRATDQKGFEAATLIALTDELVSKFFKATAPNEEANPVGDLVAVFGDSIAEGTGANSDLPSYLTAPVSGVKIWNPFLASNNNVLNAGPSTAGVLQTLQAGQNNNSSIIPYLFAYHGPEMPLADLMRPVLGDFTLIKGAVPGTFAAATSIPAPSNTIPPTVDRQIVHWDPDTRGQYFDLFVRGWMVSAIDALRKTGKKPRARLIVISLGSNDAIQAGNCAGVGLAIRGLIKAIRAVLEEQFVDISLLKFSLAVPRSSLAGLYSATQENVDLIRSSILSIPLEDASVTTVDLDNFESYDQIHLSAASNRAWIEKVVDQFGQTTSTQYRISPLFMPDGDSLRKALRLSQVPDQNDATAQIDSAVESMKVRFFQALGEPRILALQSIPYSTTPKGTSAYLRILAATTEVKGVRAQLMRTLPMLFMDGTSRTQSWNDEAAFRETSYLQTRDELKRLDNDVQQALEVLRTADFSAENSNFSVVSPDSRIAPGDTVFSVI